MHRYRTPPVSHCLERAWSKKDTAQTLNVCQDGVPCPPAHECDAGCRMYRPAAMRAVRSGLIGDQGLCAPAYCHRSSRKLLPLLMQLCCLFVQSENCNRVVGSTTDDLRISAQDAHGFCTTLPGLGCLDSVHSETTSPQQGSSYLRHREGS